MLTNVSRVWILAGAMAIGLLGIASESHAQARAWHTYSFVNSPAYITAAYAPPAYASPTYATSWTSYRPNYGYGWRAYRPFSWWANRPLWNRPLWNRPSWNWTSYRPVVGTVVGSACNPCQTRTVSYVPQTTYRLQYVDMPVTTYQPVATCDPCGRTVTTYRPITTMMRQTRRVPVTTYRPVYSYCDPCSTGVPSQAAPALVPSATFTPAPTLGPASAPKTFNKIPTEIQPELTPQAHEAFDDNTKSTNGPLHRSPRLIDPQDRTTKHQASSKRIELVHWRPAPSR